MTISTEDEHYYNAEMSRVRRSTTIYICVMSMFVTGVWVKYIYTGCLVTLVQALLSPQLKSIIKK